MDIMPMFSVLFYSVPESCLIITFGLLIVGEKLPTKQIIYGTILSVLGSYLVRAMPLPFGVHSIIGVFIVLLIFKFIIGISVKKSFLATFLSLSTLLALENTVFNTIKLNLDLNNKQIWENNLLRTVIGWPHLLIWSVITVVVYKKKMYLRLN